MSISSRIKGWAAKARALAGTHAGQQVGRFVRVAGLAAFVGWVDGGRVLSWPGLSAAAVGGVEVAYRQWRQTVAAGDATPPEPDVPSPTPSPVPESTPGPVDATSPEVVADAPDPSQGL